MVTLVSDSIQVLHHTGQAQIRRVSGYVDTYVTDNLVVYNNSVSVALRALTERLYFVKSSSGFVPCPKPASGAFSALRRFRNSLRRSMPSLPPVWSAEQFVASYTGLKAKRYEAAMTSLQNGGWRTHFSHLKTFIKGEFYNAGLKHNPCPRLIQPRSPEYNLALGCFIRPAEKLIYKAIDRVFGHHVVLKCDAPWKRGEIIARYWSEFQHPVFVGLDASRFDQHVSVDALEYEHSIYLDIFHNNPTLARLLKMQLHQVGYARFKDGALRYVVDGCRASGDMNTALGNVVLMCAMCHEYLAGLGLSQYRFINDGDDCGIFLEASDLWKLAGLEAHFLQYGFEMEVEEPAFIIEGIEFCQGKPIHVGGGQYMMVRNVLKALKQDRLFIDNKDWASVDEIGHATGMCGLALYAGFPVLDAFYRSMLSSSVRSEVVNRLLLEKDGWRYYASSKRPFMSVDIDAARTSMYYAFNILPDRQMAYEENFRAMDKELTSLVTLKSSPVDKFLFHTSRHG